MKNIIKKHVNLLTLSFVVLFASPIYAATAFTSSSTVSDVITYIIGLLNSFIPLIIGASVVVFLYGIMLFIAKSSSGNAEGRKESINFMIFGIVGIAVMMSVWGLVSFVRNTLGVGSVLPQLPTSAGSSGTSNFNQPGGAFGPTQFN